MSKKVILTVDFFAEVPDHVRPDEIAMSIDHASIELISLDSNPIPNSKVVSHITREGVDDESLEVG